MLTSPRSGRADKRGRQPERADKARSAVLTSEAKPSVLYRASTVSGVGSAPWAPSFVTAAAPARTA
jgi:hypothetical protein